VPPAPAAQPRRSMSGAALVAAGIFLSRIMGLVRGRVFTHFLGAGPAADAFAAAVRIPNFLQNLFGEGVLSASFIPVYAKLVATGDDEEAGRVAGAVGALLALTSTVVVLLGVVASPAVVTAVAGGFHDAERRDLTIRLVRVMFPGVGLLVMSAWCLGILNSHRKFFLSYVSPVAWNVVMIAALLAFGGRRNETDLVMIAAWASVAGSGVQFLVQLPTVLALDKKLRLSFDVKRPNVRTVLTNFVPVFIGRGVVQLSAYVDTYIASYVVTGAVAILGYAQVLSILPISLFGMAISAAELPAMSSVSGPATAMAAEIRVRLDRALRRIAFLIIPSAMAFIACGDILAAGVYQSGKFTRADSLWMWGVLAGSAVGLLAGAMGRLYSSAWYALRDTRTPLRFALIRVALTLGLGYLAAIPLPRLLGIDPRWGVAGLTATAGIAGWVEFVLLRKSLNARIGVTGLPLPFVGWLWVSALVAVVPTVLLRFAYGTTHPLALAFTAIPLFGLTYFGFAAFCGIEESAAIGDRTWALVRPWLVKIFGA
jgi:putative peptidoglycan lipid II flippase